jgi:RHS repeat-associated protein
MFYHVKDLQFDARVSRPDPRFAGLLLEQFGGGNGELNAAMQYFVQAFGARQPYPDKYDLNRWYGASLGRYIAVDRFRIGGRNYSHYGYALARPGKFTDPLGLFHIDSTCDNLECVPPTFRLHEYVEAD